MLPAHTQPTRINPSELIRVRELGRGAFGSVWHCRWQGVDYAMKQLFRPQAEIPYEAHVAAQFAPHPNLVRFHFVAVVPGADGGDMHLAFELLDGPLDQLLPRRAPAAPPVAPLAAGLAAPAPAACMNTLLVDAATRHYQRAVCSSRTCGPCVRFVLDLAMQVTSAVAHLHSAKVDKQHITLTHYGGGLAFLMREN